MIETNAGGRRLAILGRLLNRLATRWSSPGAGRVAVCSPLVGVVAGLGAVGFLVALEWTTRFALGGLLHFQLPPTGEGTAHAITSPWPWWLVLLVPALGGLASGLLVFSLAPEAEGHGTDALIRAFHRGAGQDPLAGADNQGDRVGHHHRLGRLGRARKGRSRRSAPGFGSALAKLLEADAQSERRLLTLAGAAGGVGAIFRAPLGGGLICDRGPVHDSAAIGVGRAAALPGQLDRGVFDVRPVHHARGRSSPCRTLALPAASGSCRCTPCLALACAAVGWVYIRVFYGLRDRVFHPLPIPRHVKPALGGLLVGLPRAEPSPR